MEDVFKEWFLTKEEISEKEKDVKALSEKLSNWSIELRGDTSSETFMKYMEEEHKLKTSESLLISLNEKYEKYEKEILNILSKFPEMRPIVITDSGNRVRVFQENGKVNFISTF